MEIAPKKSIFEIAAKIAMFCNETDKSFVKTQHSSLHEEQNSKVGEGEHDAVIK